MRRLVLLLLVFLILPLPSTSAAPYESKLKLRVYAPSTVRLEYYYTRNVTVSDVSSYGPTLYEVVHSPQEFRFEASDLDTYTFDVELEYGAITSQTLRLTIFSGSLIPSYIEFPVNAETLRFSFEVSIQNEPTYPSLEEITENIVAHMAGSLDIYQAENQRTFRLIDQGLKSYSYLMAAVVVALIILVITVYRSLSGSGG